MSTLSYQELIKKTSSVSFVLETEQSDTCIVTYSKHNKVALFNVTPEAHLISDWSLKSRNPIVKAVALDPQTYCAFSKTDIHIWSNQTANKHLKVSKDIKDLYSLSGGQAVIIYEDVTIALLSDPACCWPLVSNPGYKVMWCSSEFSSDNGTLWIVVLLTNEKSSKHMIAWCKISVSNPEDKQRYQKNLPWKDFGHDMHCLLVQGDEVPCLQIFNIQKATVAQVDLSISSSELDTSSLLAPLCTGDQRLALCAIDEHQVAIAGLVSEERVGVGIWNMKYGVLHTFEPITSSRSRSQNWKLSLCKDRLMLLTDEGVECFKLNYRKSTLSSCINKQQSLGITERLKSDDESLVNTIMMMQRLADDKQTSTLASFQKTFKSISKLLQDCQKEPGFRLALLRPASVVFQRFSCEQNSTWWPAMELQALIAAGLLETSVCQQFFPAIIRMGDIRMLSHCFIYAEDIPESCLVWCLSAILGASDETVQRAVDANTMVTSMQTDDDDVDVNDNLESGHINPLSQAKAHLVNMLLIYPHNKDSMSDSLRDLESRHVLVLLNYLHYLLIHTPHMQKDSDAHRSGRQEPIMSRLEVLDWLYMINLSHGVGVSLLTSGREIIESLQQETEKQYKDLLSCRKSSLLSSILDEAARRAKSGERKAGNGMGEYCIRILHIP